MGQVLVLELMSPGFGSEIKRLQLQGTIRGLATIYKTARANLLVNDFTARIDYCEVRERL